MNITTRAEARAQGRTKYFNGKPCPNSHKGIRYVSTGTCCECVAEKGKVWHKQNPEKAAAKHRKHREANLDKYNAWRNRHNRKRYREDPSFRATVHLRRAIRRVIEHVGAGNPIHMHELGYSVDEFIRHIESRWADGMSWENHGEWHIDHIRSVNSFIQAGVHDPAVVHALDNLQPLWAKDNLMKGDGLDSQDEDDKTPGRVHHAKSKI